MEIQWRRVTWSGHVARFKVVWNADTKKVGNWEELLVDGEVIAWISNTEGVDWIYTAQEGVHCGPLWLY